MTGKRFIFVGSGIEDNVDNESYLYNKDGFQDVCDLLNEQHEQIERLKKNFKALDEVKCELADENKQLKSDLKDCRKLKTKRLNKIRNHRAVIEDLGGSIRAYKGKIEQTNEKIDKIKEAMEDTGALTKRQLEEILND